MPNDILSIPFRQIHLSQFGLTSLKASDISLFHKRLASDTELTLRYLVAMTGFDVNDKIEF